MPNIQSVATVGATLLNTALTIQNGNGTTKNALVLGTTAAPSVATAGQVLAYNSTGCGYMEWVAQTGGGNMTSWDLTGDTGGAGTVADGTGRPHRPHHRGPSDRRPGRGRLSDDRPGGAG